MLIHIDGISWAVSLPCIGTAGWHGPVQLNVLCTRQIGVAKVVLRV